MKKSVLIIFLITQIVTLQSQDTFSIVAVDTLTGELGSAGASCIGAPQIPQGCYILSDVIPGIGVIHTQAYYTSGNQSYAHSLMLEGVAPEDMIDSLILNDSGNNPTIRQYGIVDFYTGSARTAGYSGSNCDDYKNHIVGPNYAIQGNILLGQQILDSMEARFLSAEGELACKLMAALQGAKVIGADTRCLDDSVSSLSSFLRVAQPNDPVNDLYLDLNVPSTPVGIDPIDSLQVLIDQWGGCIASSIENNLGSSQIRIFPNPAENILNFDLQSFDKTPVTIEIYSISGKLIQSIKASGGQLVKSNHNLKPGLYLSRITIKSKTINQKIVVR